MNHVIDNCHVVYAILGTELVDGQTVLHLLDVIHDKPTSLTAQQVKTLPLAACDFNGNQLHEAHRCW